MSGYVGRIAPSPTGALHLGNIRTFMVAWLRARSQGGRVVLRIEDLDHPKVKPGAAARMLEDLKWLGFDWDAQYVQSERKDLYRKARDLLLQDGLIYPCVCSRSDVENAQSAPHEGEQLHYPGTCRGRFASWQAACDHLHASHSPSPSPCWRFKVPAGTRIAFEDAMAGHYEQDVAATMGDFAVSRDEGGAGYTLAVVVDDLLMGVTEVVRGDDLLAATPGQILIARALAGHSSLLGPQATVGGLRIPAYCHLPLVVGRDGKRLAKRHGDTRVAVYRDAGLPPTAIIGRLAESLNLHGDRLVDLVDRFDLAAIAHERCLIDRVVP